MATVPTPPLKSKAINDDGYFTQAWVAFFSRAFLRMGGNVALTNIELADGQDSSISAIQNDITQLENDVEELQEVTGGGLTQGPYL